MLILDFINVGNGDAALIREMDGERQKFAMKTVYICKDENQCGQNPERKRHAQNPPYANVFKKSEIKNPHITVEPVCVLWRIGSD